MIACLFFHQKTTSLLLGWWYYCSIDETKKIGRQYNNS